MFDSNWKSWFSFLGDKKQPIKRRPTRFRPSLESLEDRLTPSSTITGHAFTDQTGNGLTADDVAKSGVTVKLYADTNHDGAYTSGTDLLVASKVTAADGSYAFTGLTAGVYTVYVSTPSGFVRTAPTTSGSLYTVNVAADATVAGGDFDYFQKINTSLVTNISYTVTDPTLGTYTVTNLRGNTHQGDTVTVNFTVVAGATVTLSLVSYDAPGASFDANNAGAQVIVDQQTGTFTAGDYSMTVQLPKDFYQVDFVVGAAIDHFGPAGSNVFYSAEGRLLSADNGGTQLQQMGSISGFVFTDTNTDSMIDSGDTGINGVQIQLTGTNDLGQSVTLSTPTDSSGFYSFSGLRQGTYTLTQTVPAGMAAVTDAAGSLGGAPSSPTVISNIVLTNGANGVNYNFLDGVFAPPPTASISGSVTGGTTTSVKITDLTTLTVYTVAVDSSGNFSMSGLTEGDSFSITATPPQGFTSDTLLTGPLTGDLTGQVVTLTQQRGPGS